MLAQEGAAAYPNPVDAGLIPEECSTNGCFAGACKGGLDNDVLTMSVCRERLAQPKSRRPPASDPSVDKDAISANMLSAPSSEQTASAPARRTFASR